MRWLASFAVLWMVLSAPAAAKVQAVVVAGLGGEPGYESDFQEWAEKVAASLRGARADVTLLKGGAASTDDIRGSLATVLDGSGVDDILVFHFIGHGTFDGENFRFNVPGPDFTAEDLARWLGGAEAGPQLVVITGSASGAVHERLKAPARTVLTATRSGNEKNATVFPRYYAEALGAEAADTDKDMAVTAVEAFQYAEAHVEAHFDQRDQLATEHSMHSGPLSSLTLARLQPLTATGGQLYARREELEQMVASLRANKSSMVLDDYFDDLQVLLLELARIDQRARSSSSAERLPSTGDSATLPTEPLPRAGVPASPELRLPELQLPGLELPDLQVPELQAPGASEDAP